MVEHGYAVAMGAAYTTAGLLPMIFSWHFAQSDPETLDVTIMPPGPCQCDQCGASRRTMTISRDAVDRAYAAPDTWSKDGEVALCVRETPSRGRAVHLTLPVEDTLCSLVMESDPLERFIVAVLTTTEEIAERAVDLHDLDGELIRLLDEEQP